jgi:hypothetical protein
MDAMGGVRGIVDGWKTYPCCSMLRLLDLGADQGAKRRDQQVVGWVGRGGALMLPGAGTGRPHPPTHIRWVVVWAGEKRDFSTFFQGIFIMIFIVVLLEVLFLWKVHYFISQEGKTVVAARHGGAREGVS